MLNTPEKFKILTYYQWPFWLPFYSLPSKSLNVLVRAPYFSSFCLKLVTWSGITRMDIPIKTCHFFLWKYTETSIYLKMKIIFLISLAIPCQLRSGIHLFFCIYLTTTKNLQVYIGISILVIPDLIIKIYSWKHQSCQLESQ